MSAALVDVPTRVIFEPCVATVARLLNNPWRARLPTFAPEAAASGSCVVVRSAAVVSDDQPRPIAMR